jgi:outer membrane protein assembly factor BamB
MVAEARGLPVKWDVQKKTNIRWIADLGAQTYGNPVVSGGRVLIGTNNGNPRDPKIEGDKGVLMCFAARDGSFLWQAVHDKLAQPMDYDWPDIGICSTPCVVGDRVYYVSNRGELMCVDLEGFHDGENDGPVTDEQAAGKTNVDVIWRLDVGKELGVVPCMASASAPLVWENLVFAVTGNGMDLNAEKVIAPKAPSFIAVNRTSGKVVWQDNSPGERILSGQWSSPGLGRVSGKLQVVFPGGDGWLYAFEPQTGELIWKFNCKAHEPVNDEGVYETENQLIATPVIHDNKVFIAVGQDPEMGDGEGCLRAIDATQTGDVTKTAELWRRAGGDFGRSISTVAIRDGLLYAAELGGFLQCLDAATGKLYWRHDLMARVWSSPLVADSKVYIANEDGTMFIFQHGKTSKQLLAEIEMGGVVHGTVAVAGDVLYMNHSRKLFAITERK